MRLYIGLLFTWRMDKESMSLLLRNEVKELPSARGMGLALESMALLSDFLTSADRLYYLS